MNFLPLGFMGGQFGGGEMILILLVVLLLFGSKNLPKIARSLGKSMEEFRRAAREVSGEIMHADQDDEPAPPAPLPKALPGTEPQQPDAEPQPPGEAPPQKDQPHESGG